jgi:hypothetical protein
MLKDPSLDLWITDLCPLRQPDLNLSRSSFWKLGNRLSFGKD